MRPGTSGGAVGISTVQITGRAASFCTSFVGLVVSLSEKVGERIPAIEARAGGGPPFHQGTKGVRTSSTW